MAIPVYLQNVKAAGIYKVVFDKSTVLNTDTQMLRLVVGYSEKGPFNIPVYIKDATEKQSLSQECRDVIDTSFLKNTKYAIYNLNKLVKDSSINQNDITSYGQCMHRKHGFTDFKNNSTFLLSSC